MMFNVRVILVKVVAIIIISILVYYIYLATTELKLGSQNIDISLYFDSQLTHLSLDWNKNYQFLTITAWRME
jgi:hypothetical protein